MTPLTRKTLLFAALFAAQTAVATTMQIASVVMGRLDFAAQTASFAAKLVLPAFLVVAGDPSLSVMDALSLMSSANVLAWL